MRAIEIFEADRAQQPYPPGSAVVTTPYGTWKVLDPKTADPRDYGIPWQPWQVGHNDRLKYFGLENSKHGNLMVITQNYSYDDNQMFPYQYMTKLDDSYDVGYLNQALVPLLKTLHMPFPPNHYFAEDSKGNLVRLSDHAPLILMGNFEKNVVGSSKDSIWKLQNASDWKYYANLYKNYVVPAEFQQNGYSIYLILSDDKSYCRTVFIAQGSELVYLENLVHNSEEVLNKLFGQFGITHSAVSEHILKKRIFVQNGQTVESKELMKTHQVAALPDGTPVYELDKTGREILPVWNFGKSWPSADRILMVENHHQVGLYFAIKNNKIVGKGPDNRKDETVPMAKRLAQVPELKLATPAAQTVKPNSAFHKMLKYIEQHPHANRSDVYTKGVGRANLLGAGSIGSITSLDGLALKADLITVDHPNYPNKYWYELTTAGHMVLSMLNNGIAVPIGDLLNSD
jgi:hypothetical protein